MRIADASSGMASGMRGSQHATQRDRMQEILARQGRLPTPGAEPIVERGPDLDAIAREEAQEMQGYHGLDVADASGMKMFYTGNTLSAAKRKEKQRQFRVVRYYVELARHGGDEDSNAANASELTALKANIAHMLFNAHWYTCWMGAVHVVMMCLSFWEAAYWGQASAAVHHRGGALTMPTWLVVLESIAVAAYVADVLLQCYAMGRKAYWAVRTRKLYLLLVLVYLIDLTLEVTSWSGKRLGRYLRPLLVLVRHPKVRAEARLIRDSAWSVEVGSSVMLVVAIMCTGAVMGLLLLRPEYANTIPGEAAIFGSEANSATSVGDFDNIHRAFFTIYATLTSADNYQFVYIARGYREAALSRTIAALFTMLLLCFFALAAATGATHLYEKYSTAMGKVELARRTRERRFLAQAFRELDDRSNGYISIEKLRYFLSTAYPEIPFEPIATRLQRNVEQQAGLVDFFDYLTIMDMILSFVPADPLENHSKRLWSMLPLGFVVVNAIVMSLFGTIANESDSALDSINAFFSFFYAIEFGTKMFALHPSRLLKSPVQRMELFLVCCGICSQVVTIIWVLPHKSLWRLCASLPLLRLFTLSARLRDALGDMACATKHVGPALVLLVLLNYIMALLGMQFFHGAVRLPSGYLTDGRPEMITFDNFESALVILVQASVGGCSQLVLAGQQLPLPTDPKAPIDWAWAVSWFLVLHRALSAALVASLLLRAASYKALDARQARLRGGAWGLSPQQPAISAPGRDADLADTAMALGNSKGQLPPMEATERQHVETLMAGIHRLGAELKVMETMEEP